MSTIEIRAARLSEVASQLGSNPSEVLAVVAYMTADAGETNDDGNLDAFLDSYGASDDVASSMWSEDLAFYRGAKSTNPDAAPFAPEAEFGPAPSEPTAEDYAAKAAEKRRAEQDAENAKELSREAKREEIKARHRLAVSTIGGMIKAKYKDEGERNFDIGRTTYDHAIRRRNDFVDLGGKHEASDLDSLFLAIREDVRVDVAISPKAIKVGEWMRCHLLRLLVAKEVTAERAERMTFFEYRSIYGSALNFDKNNVEGSIKDGWLELIRNVIATREGGGRISSDTFLEMVKDTEKRIAASKVTANPEAARLKVASDAIKADARAKTKANEDITTSISDAIGGNHITPEMVMGILETVTKHHGAEMPKSIGFDPSACSTADCDTLARAMMASGKYAEMVRLRDNLNKCLAVMDKAAEKRLAIAV